MIKKLLTKLFSVSCFHKNSYFLENKYTIRNVFLRGFSQIQYGTEDVFYCKDCNKNIKKNFDPYSITIITKEDKETYNFKPKPKLKTRNESDDFNIFINTGKIN